MPIARNSRSQNNAARWRDIDRELTEAVDFAAEYAALGVTLAGERPNQRGWIPCHAIDREDCTPSAAINVESGHYRDLGGNGLSLSFWDFAARFGRGKVGGTWREVKAHYAKQAKIRLPKSDPPADPAEHLKFLPWGEPIVACWCRTKSGVTPDAVRAFGGRLARYREQYTVIAIPILGSRAAFEPCGWVLYNCTGNPLPVFGKGKTIKWKKCKVTHGSEPGLIGLPALQTIAAAGGGANENEAAESVPVAAPPALTVWKVEGVSDALALYAAIPPHLRSTHLVLTNANGAAERPSSAMLSVFAGARVFVLHDADAPGESGAENWLENLRGLAAEVRHVRLPFAIEASHGRDLRDYLAETDPASGEPTHDYASLLALADAAAPVAPPTAVADADNAPVEADDDPHRLARVVMREFGTHPEFGAVLLRRWNNTWWHWDGRRYREVQKTEFDGILNRSIKAEFDRLNLAKLAAAADDDKEKIVAQKVVASLETNVQRALAGYATESFVPESLNSWVSPRPAGRSDNCMAFANGMLDIEALLSGAEEPDYFFPHTPAWFSPVCLPYAFDLDATCPQWIRVTSQNLGDDPELLAVAQEWAGYCLLRGLGLQSFLMCEGEGANGKSVFFAGLKAMLGTENVSHVSIEKFGERYDLYGTLGKLANIASECDELDSVAEGTLKEFTSGNPMTFERKFCDAFSAIPTAKLMFAANMRPRFRDRSEGLWRRMILLPFLYTVPIAERIAGMDQADYWTKSGETSGILNWALQGALRLRRAGRFTRSEVIESAKAEYREETNSARAFLGECCSGDEHAMTPSKELYSAYQKFCREKGVHPFAERQFGKEIKRIYPKAERRRFGPRDSRDWRYCGISMSDGF